ncbi:uncharacterized protein LOC142356747, partial [Convolutriloba macropyga]|uniref:uncharacterized protein LOC142356747 n=1 Tax=Convolutriloba macropyga TaxID=536237 RepID=UPI003F522618
MRPCPLLLCTQIPTASMSSSLAPPPDSAPHLTPQPAPPLPNPPLLDHLQHAKARSVLRVSALDAAQPFDLESRLAAQAKKEKQLKIGIIGFGNFGQFLAKRFLTHGHQVIATSRGNYSAVAAELGARFYGDIDDFCEDHPDIVILSTSIISTESALLAVPFQRLKRSTLFVDVLSVKEFPKRLFLNTLPSGFDILCLHPMFGPDSGRNAWTDLPLMYDR